MERLVNKSQLRAFVGKVNAFTPCQEKRHYKRLSFLVHAIHRMTCERFPYAESDVLESILLSARHHEGERRKTKDKPPYIIHPLEAAYTLLRLGVSSPEALMIAILHDTRENSKHGSRATAKDIREKLKNDTVSRGVELCTKPKGHDLGATLENHITSHHWQSLLAKIAERCHNLETLHVLPEETQKRKLAEVEKYFWRMCNVAEAEICTQVRKHHLPKRYLRIIPKLREQLKLRVTQCNARRMRSRAAA
jgi:(p)ppGpp synthase/HD superfamily hydrolase